MLGDAHEGPGCGDAKDGSTKEAKGNLPQSARHDGAEDQRSSCAERRAERSA